MALPQTDNTGFIVNFHQAKPKYKSFTTACSRQAAFKAADQLIRLLEASNAGRLGNA